MIAFLGTGLMGAAFVRAFLARGEQVTAWNRTRTKAEPLAGAGARVASDPADAVRGASRVHLSLLDDAAVDDVLARIVPALEPGAVIIDHSTTAPAPTAERAMRLAAQGITFVHAPVFMGPGNALNATGLMLAAAPRDVFERVRPELERMTGKVRYLGERPDIAAAYKLFGNMAIMFIVSGLADIYTLARGLDIDPRDAHTLFDDFDPGTQIKVRGKRMAEQDFVPPLFELAAARKDVRLMLEAARATGAELHVLPSIAERFDAVIAQGHGGDDLGSIAATDVK
jgi:3-hydroxyisobutyrate dehydrogenase